MVIMSGSAYTQRTAQEVASALHHLIKHPEAGTTKLDIRIERRPSGASPVVRKESTFWVKPIQPHDEAVVSLANGGEIIHLITDEGRRLDVFFGKPEERSFEPALVILASE